MLENCCDCRYCMEPPTREPCASCNLGYPDATESKFEPIQKAEPQEPLFGARVDNGFTEANRELSRISRRMLDHITDGWGTQDEKSALNTQVGGGHYKDLAIQPVEYIHANGLGFIEGCVVKYITRHRQKNGRQDIEKIKHFCDLLIDLEYGEKK